MFSQIKNDFPASIVVFLVALPLCLGISLASGAPLLSGIIAGVIGGIVVGFLSGSQKSVSGPAAGLASVVLSSITQLGSFEIFLASVVIAGFIQLGIGLFKAGFIASYVPSNVIKGLLASIGIILILKQIPHAIGYDADAEGDFSFFQGDGENTFSELIKVFNMIEPGAILITLVSLFIIIYWDKTPLKNFKFLPSSLFVVILGVVLNSVFGKFFHSLWIEKEHLVSIPEIKLNNLTSIITFPDFSQLMNYQVWVIGLTIAIIASLETLLNLEAVDIIDPEKRISPPNKELVAQGIGNILSGFIGGLPITSVIVRSSVNINAGAQTKLSAILHGLFLFIAIIFLSSSLNLIPLASLAAILLVTGYKLAKVSIFKDMYKKGANQFIPFFATIMAIIFSDLLIGILIGLAISLFFVLKSNYRNPFVLEKQDHHIGEVIRIELPNQVSFLNKASIKDTLWSIEPNSKVVIDASNADFIDNDILEILIDYRDIFAPENKIQLNMVALKANYELHDHIQFVNVLDKNTLSELKPQDILNLLKKGNERFIAGNLVDKYFQHQVNATSMGQNPMAVIVSCMDSRTSPEIVFDMGMGDILTIRIAGNIINEDIVESLEIACQELGAKLIVIMGHAKCGAIHIASENFNNKVQTSISNKIEPVLKKCSNKHEHLNLEDKELMKKITCLNTENSLNEVLEKSTYLDSEVKAGKIAIVSAYYDTSNGQVTFEEKSKVLA